MAAGQLRTRGFGAFWLSKIELQRNTDNAALRRKRSVNDIKLRPVIHGLYGTDMLGVRIRYANRPLMNRLSQPLVVYDDSCSRLGDIYCGVRSSVSVITVAPRRIKRGDGSSRRKADVPRNFCSPVPSPRVRCTCHLLNEGHTLTVWHGRGGICQIVLSDIGKASLIGHPVLSSITFLPDRFCTTTCIVVSRQRYRGFLRAICTVPASHATRDFHPGWSCLRVTYISNFYRSLMARHKTGKQRPPLAGVYSKA